jgi:hypothetical protein
MNVARVSCFNATNTSRVVMLTQVVTNETAPYRTSLITTGHERTTLPTSRGVRQGTSSSS